MDLFSNLKSSVTHFVCLIKASPAPNPPDAPVYSVVQKLDKKKFPDPQEPDFTILPSLTEEGTSLSDLAKLLSDTQHLLDCKGNLRASLTVSKEPPQGKRVSPPGHKMSWYERENHRVASKLEKDGATGKLFHT